MNDASRVRLLRGFGELAAGALCLIVLAATFVGENHAFHMIGMFLFGFMTLTADGIYSLTRSRKIARFR
jgi:hypothetical protein